MCLSRKYILQSYISYLIGSYGMENIYFKVVNLIKKTIFDTVLYTYLSVFNDR